MHTARITAGSVVLLLFAAGCAEPGAAGTPDDASEAADVFYDRAAQVASAWVDSDLDTQWHAGFVPLEPLTVLPDRSATDEVAQALSAGWLRTDLALPTEAPDNGEIVYSEGDPQSVPLVSVAQAWDAVAMGEPVCPEEPAPQPTATGPDSSVSSPVSCTVLTVTDAYAGEVAMATSRGPAQVPAWLFEVEELAEPFARVAVAPAAVIEPPRLDGIDSPHQPGLATAMGLVSVAGPGLTYQLGIGACDDEPTALVYETAEVVVVGGTVTAKPGTTVCTDQLVLAELAVRLEQPVGQRPVLATTGQVLTVGWW